MSKIVERMKKKGFTVVELNTAEEARAYLLEHIAEGSSVGVGGSVSVRQTEVLPALQEKGCTIYSHWDVDTTAMRDTQQKARLADVYLTSANAITKHGALVLVDGVGNRVSAVADGPKQLYFIVSQSKVADGGYGKAIARIKTYACPPNARRIGLDTPCARTNVCDPDACGEDCMCRVTLVVDRVPRGREITVLFIQETLGY